MFYEQFNLNQKFTFNDNFNFCEISKIYLTLKIQSFLMKNLNLCKDSKFSSKIQLLLKFLSRRLCQKNESSFCPTFSKSSEIKNNIKKVFFLFVFELCWTFFWKITNFWKITTNLNNIKKLKIKWRNPIFLTPRF